ncbi:hypothetical protein CEXT_216081 [Caerostris extrusa]|uniref:Uncharacterized protein n=1 Tax=Caerostris extrusa TaxID=172846 RepID=A0AAV4STQ5_CAEEX|nr:hypothetical protein CEXT_216081 [Caerostris extrusa]
MAAFMNSTGFFNRWNWRWVRPTVLSNLQSGYQFQGLSNRVPIDTARWLKRRGKISFCFPNENQNDAVLWSDVVLVYWDILFLFPSEHTHVHT